MARKPFGRGWLWTDDPACDDFGIPKANPTWVSVVILAILTAGSTAVAIATAALVGGLFARALGFA